jgi:uncharacterized protein with PQ loop repeat
MSSLVVESANILQLAVPAIALVAYVPQWVKICHTRSSVDISLRAWCLWTVSSVFALYYAVVQLLQHGQGWPLVVSAAIGLSAVLLTVVLVLRYRPRRKSMKGEGNNE